MEVACSMSASSPVLTTAPYKNTISCARKKGTRLGRASSHPFLDPPRREGSAPKKGRPSQLSSTSSFKLNALSEGKSTENLTATSTSTAEFIPGPLDDLFLMLFRRKLAKETGWQSPNKGYEGMIEEAKRLLNMFPDRRKAEEAAVRILLSFFPPGLLPLFKRFIAPAMSGKLGPFLSAMVTLVTCQWLMGPSKSSEVQLPDGTLFPSGVKIEKCRFLEETKCAGSCIHTCKLPTQAFMQEHMGVPLHMEPNYEDFSCEFRFGVPAPPLEQDEILSKPCLSICPVANGRPIRTETCPEVIT